MGYRSEVAIRCQENAFLEFKDAYEKAHFNPDKLLTNGDEHLLYWDWVKWYEGYDIVDRIEDVMSRLEEMENIDESGYGYKFMRLGEDDEDIETRSNTYSVELYMVRKIDLSDFE